MRLAVYAVVGVGALWLLGPKEFEPRLQDIPTIFTLVMIVLALGVMLVLLKFRRVIKVFRGGVRVKATVLRLTNVGGEDEPDLFVLDWKDADGFFGFSQPDRRLEFEGYDVGDEITVYRIGEHESWWERDVLR